ASTLLTGSTNPDRSVVVNFAVAQATSSYPLAEAARLLAVEAGQDVHPGTVNRWILYGLRTRDGRRVRLAATRVGGRRALTRKALGEFLTALSALPVGSSPFPEESRSADGQEAFSAV